MLENIKLFATNNNRLSYEDSEDYIEPYVSYVEGDNTVHYNKPFKAILIATYNVEDTSNSTPLFVNAESMGFPASSIYDKIEIDNVEIDMSNLSSLGEYYVYDFERSGQHTGKYTLKDPTMIGAEIDEETGRPSNVGAMFAVCPITSVEIPDSVTSIGYGSFIRCSSLTSITIGNSVISIGNGAFGDCSGLTSIIIGNSVTNIGENAFSNCSGLTNVTMGNGVTSIGEHAFDGCSSLTGITIKATTPPTLSSYVFENNASGRKIYVPNESVEAYKAATNWNMYAAYIESIPTT